MRALGTLEDHGQPMLTFSLDNYRMESKDFRTSALKTIRAAMDECRRKAMLAANKHPVERARLRGAAVILAFSFSLLSPAS